MGQQMPMRDIGPCEVYFGGTSLGETLGGVTLTHTQNTADIKEDRWGDTPVDMVGIGDVVTVEANLARMSLAQLYAALLGASSIDSDTKVMGSIVGVSLRDNAQTLELRPIVEGTTSSTASEYVSMAFAAPKLDNAQLMYDVATQRSFKVTFAIMPVLVDNTPTGWKKGQTYRIGGAVS